MREFSGFTNLKVWEKAHYLTLNIYKLTKSFPKEENFCLTNQIRRSAISIGANIAEGYKKSKKDFLRILYISQGSLEETKYHLILARDLHYCSVSEFEEFLEIANEVGRMISGLCRQLKIQISFLK